MMTAIALRRFNPGNPHAARMAGNQNTVCPALQRRKRGLVARCVAAGRAGSPPAERLNTPKPEGASVHRDPIASDHRGVAGNGAVHVTVQGVVVLLRQQILAGVGRRSDLAGRIRITGACASGVQRPADANKGHQSEQDNGLHHGAAVLRSGWATSHDAINSNQSGRHKSVTRLSKEKGPKRDHVCLEICSPFGEHVSDNPSIYYSIK